MCFYSHEIFTSCNTRTDSLSLAVLRSTSAFELTSLTSEFDGELVGSYGKGIPPETSVTSVFKSSLPSIFSYQWDIWLSASVC